jgi:RNA polymerase sigma-70 factor (ECF subfamily)
VTTQTTSDRELALAYVLHDDARAFRELHRRLEPYLLAVARKRSVPHDQARDLVQQAFLNAHLSRDRFDLESEFRPWVTRILVNLAIDRNRASQRRRFADLDPAEVPAPAEPDAAERRRDIARARRALASLRPGQRTVVEMHWLEERPFPEVAAVLGERVSTVKVRAHRAYRELRCAIGAL